MSEEPESESTQAKKRPYADVLRQYDREQRRAERKRLKSSHDDRAAEKQARRDARVRRRGRRQPYIRALVWIFGLLPPAVAGWLGEWGTALLYRFSARARERSEAHLGLAFPEKSPADRSKLARQSVRLIARGMASLPALRRKGAAWMLERIEVIDEHVMQEALDRGKGAIIVTLHFGPMAAGGVWLAHRWHGRSVGRDSRTLDPLQVVMDLRTELGLPIIERGDPRAIVRALRDNNPVAILADHDIGNLNGAFVPFFGHLAHTPVGPAALSVRTGAPIILAVNDWCGLTRYRVRVLEMMLPREDLPRDEAILELTYRFTKRSEQVIRERPEHWMWMHKRWETRPEKRPDLPVWTPPDGPDADVRA